jgi:hypothetical protein
VNYTISLTKKSGMKQIIGIGNALVDIVTLIDDDRLLEQLSLPNGSMQLVDQDRSVQIICSPGFRGFGRTSDPRINPESSGLL